MRLLILLCFSLPASLCAQRTLVLEEGQYGLARNTNFILCRADLAEINGVGTPVSGLELDGRYELEEPRSTFAYGETYQVRSAEGTHDLIFTELPLVQIVTYADIPDEPKVPARITYADDDQVFSSFVGIETRGGYSQILPKKSYDLELWADSLGTVNRDASFGGMREDDDWILDGVYNEPFRINAFLSHKLWLDIHEPYYLAEEPRARTGADVLLCEVLLNGNYWGVHFLSEPIDRKQLQLKRYRDDEPDRMRGELYKGVQPFPGVLLFGVPPAPDNQDDDWAGFELKYPDPDDRIEWNNLYDLIVFILESSDRDFRENVWQRMDRMNVVDYFIFMNLTGAEDNFGKNIYFSRYDEGEPYVYAAWDLDGTLGNRWDGTDFWQTSVEIKNGLHRRLMAGNVGGFNDLFCSRYAELEAASIIKPERLRRTVRETYDYLVSNGVYAREARVWPGSVDGSEDRLAYTLNWIDERTDFMRRYSCDVNVSTRNPGPAINATVVYPNPVTHELRLTSAPSHPQPYRILDAAGRSWRVGTLNGGTSTVEVATLPPGGYFLWFNGRSYRFVKQ